MGRPIKSRSGGGSAVAIAACAKAVNAGAQLGIAALAVRHKAWWAAYWPQSFVSLPVTRLEGYYYTEMYRFVSSDRIGLHGLMGAFGPSGMFDLWPDDVWDMNEEVMYWLAAASNRRQISDPMLRFMEINKPGTGYNGGKVGNLWMWIVLLASLIVIAAMWAGGGGAMLDPA